MNDPLNLKPLDRYYNNGTLVKQFIKKCLNRDPSARTTASDLLNDPWIKTMVEEEVVQLNEQESIGVNMASFGDATLFQSSVVTFLVRLKSDKEDMSKLRRVFTKLDQDHNGFLSHEEIRSTMESFSTEQNCFGREVNWKKIIQKADTNRDGKISFEEFLTAACDRRKILNKKCL